MVSCPDCGGTLRVYRTYHRPAHNSTRHYCECQQCGERHYTETVYGGRVSRQRRATAAPTLDYERVKDTLRQQMTQGTFDQWVAATRLHYYNGNGRVVIATDNPLALDWLQSRLVAIFERSLSSEIGHAVTVEFIVNKKVC